MNRDMVFTLIAAIFYLAILYLLVRPSSNGPSIINTIFTSFSDLVRGTIGYTYDNSTGEWNAP